MKYWLFLLTMLILGACESPREGEVILEKGSIVYFDRERNLCFRETKAPPDTWNVKVISCKDL